LQKVKKSMYVRPIIAFVFLLFLFCSDSDINPLVGMIDRGDIQAPEQLPQPTLSEVGNGEITISWLESDTSDVVGYRLYRSENEDDLSVFEVIFDSLATSYRDINLVYTTVYYYRVTAYDSTGNESGLSISSSGIPHNTLPPSAPVNLTIFGQNISSPLVELSWDDNPESDVSTYLIYRSIENSFTPDESVFLDSSSTPLFFDTEISANVNYYYTIEAKDKGGLTSNASEIDSDIALLQPELLLPVNGLQVQPNTFFTWEPVENALQYKFFVQSSIEGEELWTALLDNSQNSIQYSGETTLVSGTEYFWKVATFTKDLQKLNSLSPTERFVIQ